MCGLKPIVLNSLGNDLGRIGLSLGFDWGVSGFSCVYRLCDLVFDDDFLRSDIFLFLVQ